MTVILAAGLFPQTPHVLAFLEQADFIACCDGAADNCCAAGCIPDLIIGDGDSLSPALMQQWADRTVRIPDQETNDLTKTIRYLLQMGRKDKFVILGATGLREDHALANLALLMDYAEWHDDVTMISDFGTFYPCRNSFRQRVDPGQEISIFNFGATAFESQGLQYPLYDFTLLWQGTLNKALQPDVEIRAKGKFLVYVAEQGT